MHRIILCEKQAHKQSKSYTVAIIRISWFEDVPLVEFVYLVLTRMPGESYCRRRRSLLYLCDVFHSIINSLVCWFYWSAFSDVFCQNASTIRQNIDSCDSIAPSGMVDHLFFWRPTVPVYCCERDSCCCSFVKQMAPKWWDLHPIIKSLFVPIVVINPPRIHVVNESLLSDTSPAIFERAIVKPLLKKKIIWKITFSKFWKGL